MNFQRVKLLSLLFASVILSACFSDIDVVVDPKDLVIPSQNDKSKVQVIAVEDQAFSNHIRSVLPKAESMKEAALSSIKRREESIEEMNVLLRQGEALRGQMPDIDDRVLARMDPGFVDMALRLRASKEANLNASNRTRQMVSEATAEVERLKRELIDLENGGSRIYFDGKIDGEIQLGEFPLGREFEISVPKDKKYALILRNKDRTWAFWIGPVAEEKKVTLYSYNTTGSGCGECIFGKSRKPNSFAAKSN